MLRHMLGRDIRRNKAIHLTLCLFILLAALLVAGAFCIIAEQMGAMSAFFEKAKVLHYMQMVTGEVDQQAIDAFSAENEVIEAQQTLPLLGIDNSLIYYGDNPDPYTGSVMENLFVTQSPLFDFLLDEHNEIVAVAQGEVAAPLYAMDAYGLEIGDKLRIQDGDFEAVFTVTAFVRDSQMNPSLVSSKRFVVSAEDYELLSAHTGEVEYLIEFRLTDLGRIGEFDSAYLEAGLPAGIAITLPILRLMNAMTGGLIAAVLLLASLLLLVIAMLCLRFTMLTTLEEEYREIGVMKAIGIAPKQIGRLYRAKYLLLGAVSCIAGLLLALAFSGGFIQEVNRYIGTSSGSLGQILLPMLGALAVYAAIAGYCTLVLRKLRKVSVVEAICGVREGGKQPMTFPLHRSRLLGVNSALGVRDVCRRFRNYAMPIFVFLLCAFLIIVPINFLHTLQSPSFVGYMGMGNCDAVITLRYSGDVETRYDDLLETLKKDDAVTTFAPSVIANYKAESTDGEWEHLRIRIGNFETFPLPYLSGGAPEASGAIALSQLNAQGLGKQVGDSILVQVEGELVPLTVCGIYQDLTNGGKTAQAFLPYTSEEVLWYNVSVNFAAGVNLETKLAEYNEAFAPAKAIGTVDYIAQTFAATTRQLEQVTGILTGVAVFLAVLITILFMKMLLAKDRGQLAVMKGLGFTNAHLRAQYIAALVLSLLVGLGLGLLAAGNLGEGVAGLLMGTMGASHIDFVINPWATYVACPLLLLLTVVLTTWLSSSAIQKSPNRIITE